MTRTMAWSVLFLTLPFAALVGCAIVKVGWRRSLAHLFAYTMDMLLALVGFTMGFGLQVVDWWWVITPMVMGRFVFHALNGALHVSHAEEKAKQEKGDE